MSMKSSTIALGAVSMITAALVLSGCSSSDDGAATSETSSETSSVTSSVTSSAAAATTSDESISFSGERVTLNSGTDADAPVISVSLPDGWSQTQEGTTGSVTDILWSNQTDTNRFMPNTTLTVESQGTVSPDAVLAGAQTSLGMLAGWTEANKVDLDIDGQKAIRIAGTWTPPNVGAPLYAVMTVIAYQADESSPVYLVSFANQFTDTEDMALSDQVEEINTSIEFG
ncbi:LpqN/LpqT family lipoprotein [Rhodococcus sp. NPDC056743]|uniref:LpqN/LpqT family lipoprotein n=1 Tax=Rhodococcus sp. NPDC056743 TaxID=3345934 RepID=UPI003671CB6A